VSEALEENLGSKLAALAAKDKGSNPVPLTLKTKQFKVNNVLNLCCFAVESL
jgi:hypothetical protein